MNWKELGRMSFIVSIFFMLFLGVVLAFSYVFRGISLNDTSLREIAGWIIVIHPNDSGLDYNTASPLVAEQNKGNVAGIQVNDGQGDNDYLNRSQSFNIPVDYSVELDNKISPNPAPESPTEIEKLIIPVIGLREENTDNTEFMPTELASENSSLAIQLNSSAINPQDLEKRDVIILQTNEKNFYYKVDEITTTAEFDSIEYSRNTKKNLALIVNDEENITVIKARLI
jgi:hypothetical protein